jgi:bifunctional non-homologous end joining protein LigD
VTPVTNADRVLYPDAGYTKGDVAAYYAAAAPLLLAHVAGRPLTLKRFPKGIASPGFMQKNTPDHYPDVIGRCELPKEGGTVRYAVVNDAEGIAYLANLSTLEFHPWPALTSRLGEPERLIIDLDPPAGRGDAAIPAARRTRQVLDALGADPLLLATGSKGFHLVVPLLPGAEYRVVDAASQEIAALVTAADPDLLTTEFLKKDRGARVFVDWLRNRPGATSIAPWSLRGLPGAPLASPLAWEEIEIVGANGIGLDKAAGRLTEPDPWADYEARRVDAAALAAAATTAVAAAGLVIEPHDRFGRRSRP